MSCCIGSELGGSRIYPGVKRECEGGLENARSQKRQRIGEIFEVSLSPPEQDSLRFKRGISEVEVDVKEAATPPQKKPCLEGSFSEQRPPVPVQVDPYAEIFQARMGAGCGLLVELPMPHYAV